MIKKYNLVLLPLHHQKLITELSRNLHDLAYTYFLNESSLPHLTLYQFEYEETDLDSLWQSIQQFWNDSTVSIELSAISFITFDDNIYWASLVPKKSQVLYDMHIDAAKILNLPAKLNFDPHVTLINTLQKDNASIVRERIGRHLPIKDQFAISLGSRDEHGQFEAVAKLI